MKKIKVMPSLGQTVQDLGVAARGQERLARARDNRGQIAQKMTKRPSSSTESVIRKEFQKKNRLTK